MISVKSLWGCHVLVLQPLLYYITGFHLSYLTRPLCASPLSLTISVKDGMPERSSHWFFRFHMEDAHEVQNQ